MSLVGEFTVEPFVPGHPGPHVTAAFAAAEAMGARLDVGPFGNSIRAADDEVMLGALEAAIRAALGAGATRVAVQISVE
jgi:uncharacterized protein YqgV (UPF0045/DUF77 family)